MSMKKSKIQKQLAGAGAGSPFGAAGYAVMRPGAVTKTIISTQAVKTSGSAAPHVLTKASNTYASAEDFLASEQKKNDAYAARSSQQAAAAVHVDSPDHEDMTANQDPALDPSTWVQMPTVAGTAVPIQYQSAKTSASMAPVFDNRSLLEKLIDWLKGK